jgi:hypothetical protein
MIEIVLKNAHQASLFLLGVNRIPLPNFSQIDKDLKCQKNLAGNGVETLGTD